MKIGLCIMVLSSCISCGDADQVQTFQPPPNRLFTPLGEWSESAGYRFRIVKVEEATSLALANDTFKAPAGTRFVAVTVDVLPLKLEKDSVNYLSAVSLVDLQGKGYLASEERFLKANGGSEAVLIEPARFVERVVPFLVPKDFAPAAMRCVGGKDSEPCWLGLRRR